MNYDEVEHLAIPGFIGRITRCRGCRRILAKVNAAGGPGGPVYYYIDAETWRDAADYERAAVYIDHHCDELTELEEREREARERELEKLRQQNRQYHERINRPWEPPPKPPDPPESEAQRLEREHRERNPRRYAKPWVGAHQGIVPDLPPEPAEPTPGARFPECDDYGDHLELHLDPHTTITVPCRPQPERVRCFWYTPRWFHRAQPLDANPEELADHPEFTGPGPTAQPSKGVGHLSRR